MTAAVRAEQRFVATRPCPVCGGHKDLPQGQSRRCWGFCSDDGCYAHCTREEYAGALTAGPDGSYAHRLTGDCRCGVRHGSQSPLSANPPAISRESFAGNRASQHDVVKRYEYKNESGELLFEVLRKPGKNFPVRRPDSSRRYVLQVRITDGIYAHQRRR